MQSLLEQVKKRRKALGFKQHDMLLRVGMSRQQYQQLESKGNPRLDTLKLISKGLNAELMLIPQEKLNAVLAVLMAISASQATPFSGVSERKPSQEDPWQAFLGDDD